jgi:hypothetical protein
MAVNEPVTDFDPLLAFPSEFQPPAAGPATPVTRAAAEATRAPVQAKARPAWLMVAAGVVMATIGFVAFELARDRWVPGAATTTGALTVDTAPAGADVVVNGERRGVTPVTLSLSPGDYTVAVRLGGAERTRPVTLVAGGSAAQFFEFATGGVPAPNVTNPAAAAAPSPALVNTPTPPAGSVGGWLSVESPFEVRVLEGDEVVGVSSTSRIMLTAGRHQVTLSNPALDFAQTATVTITPGRRTTFVVDPPKVNLNVNARPWADVSIDTVDAGQTPIANLPIALGTHQVVFRHPELGERRQTIVVTAKGPNRVSMDMTQPR